MPSDASEKVNWSGVDIHLDEGQRQLTLLALAKLSIERPGFVWALEEIAKLMDNVDGDRAELFRSFRRIHGADQDEPRDVQA